jgi:surface carbohydrate biosynthesis protein
MYKTNYNSNNIDVLLFVEHKDRELEITCEIANLLENKYNLQVAIASLIYEPMSSVFKINSKVVVTPSTAFGNGSAAWIYNTVFGDQVTFVNMNYEQFISSWKGKYKVPSHEVSINKQKHFVWGNYFLQTLVDGRINKNNVYLTGRPLSTLIKEKYLNRKEIHRKEISQNLNLDIKKKWYFIALTDGLAFVGEEKIQFIAKNGGHEKGLRDHIDYVKKTIKEMIIWLDKFEKETLAEDYYFILRPHPSISSEQYEKLFNEIIGYIPKNIRILKDFSAYKWLEASDKYFTNYSTLALDAEILEKPFYVFKPILKDMGEDYWWCDSGIELKTYSDFLKSCKSEDEEFINNKVLNNSFIDFKLDGIMKSAEFINIFVQKYDKNSYPKVSYLKKLSPFFYNFRRTFGSFIRLFFIKNNLNLFNVLRAGNIVDYFTNEDIDNIKGKK